MKTIVTVVLTAVPLLFCQIVVWPLLQHALWSPAAHGGTGNSTEAVRQDPADPPKHDMSLHQAVASSQELLAESSLGSASTPAPGAPCNSTPDLAEIEGWARRGSAVHAPADAWAEASKRFNSSRNLYIFLMSPAYWGSAAVLSLLASSPQVATLCRAGGHACEGTDLLWRRKMMSPTVFNRLEREYTWEEAMDVWEQWWGKMPEWQKPVRVERSTALLANVDLIASYFDRHPELEPVFLFLTRSPCSCGAPCQPGGRIYEAPGTAILNAMSELWKFPQMLLRYEDLIRNPYEVAERLLEFVPALRSLNPAVNPLPKLSTRLGGREMSLVDFARSAKSSKVSSLPRPSFSPQTYEMSHMLGYQCCEPLPA